MSVHFLNQVDDAGLAGPAGMKKPQDTGVLHLHGEMRPEVSTKTACVKKSLRQLHDLQSSQTDTENAAEKAEVQIWQSDDPAGAGFGWRWRGTLLFPQVPQARADTTGHERSGRIRFWRTRWKIENHEIEELTIKYAVGL